MTWILFDIADRRTPAPSFCLASIMKREVCREDYRGRDNLVLFFPPARPEPVRSGPTDSSTGGAQGWHEALDSFVSWIGEYNQNEAVVLAVLPGKPASLLSDPALLELPFPILADPEASVRRKYAALMDTSLVSEADGLVFILDRYGCPYAALIDHEAFAGKKFDAPAFHRDVLKWLEYISMQCPE